MLSQGSLVWQVPGQLLLQADCFVALCVHLCRKERSPAVYSAAYSQTLSCKPATHTPRTSGPRLPHLYVPAPKECCNVQLPLGRSWLASPSYSFTTVCSSRARALQATMRERDPFAGEKFLYGGIANAIAGVSTNPTDVLKVRLQMQNELSKQATTAAVAVQPQQQLTLLQMARHMVRTEGLAALMNGWQASVMREMSYSAIRMGLYDEVKELLAGDGDGKYTFPLWKKVVAGGVSGCIGAAIANPTDLLKVRAQAMNAATGQPFYSYPNPWTALAHIYRHEGGLLGLYRGVVPTTQRAIILTATQFAMYDETKYLLLGSGLLQEGIAAHMCASIMAGLAVATTTNPIDLIKSRFMNQAFDPATGKGMSYSGVLDCFTKTLRAEGVSGLYKGWLPNWLRIGPHTVITFLTFEAMRKAAGLGAV